MKISAVIFDLDGTVLDNEGVWAEAFKEVLKKLGKEVHDKYPQEGGVGVKENWPKLLAKYNIKTDKTAEELEKETHDAYLAHVSEVRLAEGFREFAEQLRESGVRLGLATSSIWPVLEATLDKFDLEGTFDVITTGEEVILKKPAPDLFLVTADKLDIPPSECLIIEDSPAGIVAAREAGMKVIGIAKDEDKEKSLEKADLVVEGFDSITPEALASL